jgi:cytochrome bd-type quinol oxidase subunit 2
MGLHKILKWAALALAVIGAIFAILLISGNEGMIDNMLYISYVVLALILVIVLIYVVKGLLSGNVKKTLISIGLFLAIVLVSYFASSGTDLDLEPFISKGQDVSEASSKNVGAGLYTFYVLAIVAIGTMAFSGVKKIMK